MKSMPGFFLIISCGIDTPLPEMGNRSQPARFVDPIAKINDPRKIKARKYYIDTRYIYHGLDSLSPIAPNTVCKRPTLPLKLLILLQFHSFLCNNRNAILV